MQNDIVHASIITIGDELMIGQVVDTNSAWIAQQLNKEGIWIRKRVSVGDNHQEIWKALDEESSLSALVILTGGLGPTADDITKPLLCEYFGSSMRTDAAVLKHVQHLFENVLKRPFTELNRKQAEVPSACTVIHNARGTAPGMLFEKNDVVYISMPGVPYEMKGMMTDLVLPIIKKRFSPGVIIHKTLLTAGVGESFLAEHINAWERSLPLHIKLAYMPGYGMVRLRITGTGKERNQLEAEISEHFTTLKTLVEKWLVTDQDISLAQAVSNILREKKYKLVTAESCTGGYIAHLITIEPDASDVFNGSVICYANKVKTDMLQVKDETIRAHGAVSEETVIEMIYGALQVLDGDCCIATSGIMGPSGGTKDKPVGTVWVAVGNSKNIITHKFHFRFDRLRNIETTAAQALNLLRKFLMEEPLFAANTR